MTIQLTPVGYVYSTRINPIDDNWDSEEAYIELADPFNEESLVGLKDFSHVEIVFFMHQVPAEEVVLSAKHPRDRTDWPRVGIFAQRHRKRPNRIGVTIARIKAVEGRRLYIEGLDAIDGTPVIDIKPWVVEFGPRGPVSQPSWMIELMKEYWDEGSG